MRALVTGAAGFVGSTLSERLVDDGWDVVGVDSLDPYYDVALKRANVAALTDRREFELIEDDLLDLDLPQVMADVDVVFHQAAQPGVRLSWASRFDTYVRANVLATQRLLEAARLTEPSAVVYASSSSVYGRITAERTTEDDPLVPFSPYGVTKLAGEHLCTAYGQNFGVPTVALRYFTVYGPRQRPDMALHRLVRAAADGSAVPLFGDGEQVRDFTFVDDVVEANLRAARARCEPGTSINVAGGSSA